MNLKDLFLNLDLRCRLDDSIPIIASILRKPLIRVRAAFIRVIIQIFQVIHHHGWALHIIPHERVVDMGLWHLRLSICQDDFMRHKSFLLENHLYRVFLLDDLLRCGSSWRRRSRGCSGISSIVGILIYLFILNISYAVKSSSLGDLHNQLIVRLNHSFKDGLLFLQLLSVFPQPLAQGLHLHDLLA
jgi:hypothetical protein